jgi:REP element-mobilizing transposase RayT
VGLPAVLERFFAFQDGGQARRYIGGMTHGIHLIWTTYGTWLPGDDRGHWSPLFDLYGSIREQGGQLNSPDEITRTRSGATLTEAAKRLTEEEIAVVASELGQHLAVSGVADSQLPPAWAATIEANHVHLLVGPVNEDLARFVGRLKGRTSSVVGALPVNSERERVWTSGYWKVFLFDAVGVVAVKRYIDLHNVRRGLPAEPFPCISPCPHK